MATGGTHTSSRLPSCCDAGACLPIFKHTNKKRYSEDFIVCKTILTMQDERNISVKNMEFPLKKYMLLHYEDVTKRVGWKCVNIF